MSSNDNSEDISPCYWIVVDGIKREVTMQYARDFLKNNPEYTYRWDRSDCYIEKRKENEHAT